MFVRIERGSSIPISRQIADQIRAQCLTGRAQPGTQLPSVRQLAKDLAVNQNTILRVYEKLTAEKLLEMRHGEGTFVAQELPTGQLTGQRLLFVDEFTQLIRRGRLLGLSTDELESLLRDALRRSDEDEETAPAPATTMIGKGEGS